MMRPLSVTHVVTIWRTPDSYRHMFPADKGRLHVSLDEAHGIAWEKRHIWSGDTYSDALNIAFPFVARGYFFEDMVGGKTTASFQLEGGAA